MRATDYPYCQSPFTVLAHRGGAGMAINKGIENTLAAFGHAVEVGCTYLETDAVSYTHLTLPTTPYV